MFCFRSLGGPPTCQPEKNWHSCASTTVVQFSYAGSSGCKGLLLNLVRETMDLVETTTIIFALWSLKDQGPGITGQTFARSCSSHTAGASHTRDASFTGLPFLHIHRTSKTKKGRKAQIAQSKLTRFKKAMGASGTNWQMSNNLRQALISNLIRPVSSMTPECVECFTSPDSCSCYD